MPKFEDETLLTDWSRGMFLLMLEKVPSGVVAM